MNNDKMIKNTVYSCFTTYFMSGVVIMCFGAIMPELIAQKGISFTLAGGLLTFLTVGNLVSTMLYPAVCVRFRERNVRVVLCSLYPICLFLFTLAKSLFVLYILIFLIGLNRGIITLTNNRTVNEVTGNSTRHANLLHMCYAVGALLSPFLIALLTNVGISWETILRGIAIITIAIPVLYMRVDTQTITDSKEDISCAEGKVQNRAQVNITSEEPEFMAATAKADANKKIDSGKASVFLCMIGFWLMLGMNFCYMGLEYTVNGWFETYLQQRGIMSDTMATMMVSVTWAMMMIGRIIIASLSGKIKTPYILSAITIIQLIAVILLFNSNTASMVAISLVILGLGFAGISPTVIAYTGSIVNNSHLGISVLTGVGSLGGIFLPQLIGIVADSSGFNSAIALMLVCSIVLAVLGFLTIIESGGKK